MSFEWQIIGMFSGGATKAESRSGLPMFGTKFPE